MPLTVPDFLAPLLAQPVAVLGGGVSGDGLTILLRTLGVGAKVYDAKGLPFTSAAAREHALVVFSPGFEPTHPWLVTAREARLECLGELDFASLFWRGPVVAITGTNGKTTMTEFLTHALRSVGRLAHATGNIGHPFSRLAAERDGGTESEFAVCEVSSFQAETLKHFRAAATLWTNFAEDHLERHPGLEAYFAAKWKLVEHTRAGAAFVGSSVRRYAEQFGQPLTRVMAVETEGRTPDRRLEGTVFDDYPQRENFILAQAWWARAQLEDSALVAAARTFKLGRHRLTRVANVDEVTYWNDSKATNFHAVEAALQRFSTPVVLIAGGKAKGGDLRGFVARLREHVHHVLLIGATAPELARHCETFGVAHTVSGTMAKAVWRASELAPRGGHVLLSPGFASFDQFKNYEDRGEQFEKLVAELIVISHGKSRAAAPSFR